MGKVVTLTKRGWFLLMLSKINTRKINEERKNKIIRPLKTKTATLKLKRQENSKWPKRKQSKIQMMNLENPQDRDLLLNVPDQDHVQGLHLQQDLKVVLMLAA